MLTALKLHFAWPKIKTKINLLWKTTFDGHTTRMPEFSRRTKDFFGAARRSKVWRQIGFKRLLHLAQVEKSILRL